MVSPQCFSALRPFRNELNYQPRVNLKPDSVEWGFINVTKETVKPRLLVAGEAIIPPL